MVFKDEIYSKSIFLGCRHFWLGTTHDQSMAVVLYPNPALQLASLLKKDKLVTGYRYLVYFQIALSSVVLLAPNSFLLPHYLMLIVDDQSSVLMESHEQIGPG